jgi:hypothetical protein
VRESKKTGDYPRYEEEEKEEQNDEGSFANLHLAYGAAHIERGGDVLTAMAPVAALIKDLVLGFR